MARAWTTRTAMLGSALSGAVAAAAVAFLALALSETTPGLSPVTRALAFLDRGLGDALMRTRPLGAVDERIVIVEIDDGSIERLGEFPLPRRHYSDFFQAAGQAAAIGVDIVFPDHSRRFSRQRFEEGFAQMVRAQGSALAADQGRELYERLAREEDSALAAQVRSHGRVVIAGALPDPVAAEQELSERTSRATAAFHEYENRHRLSIVDSGDQAESHLRRLALESEIPLAAFRQVLAEREFHRQRLVLSAAAAFLPTMNAADRAAWEAAVPGADPQSPGAMLVWLFDQAPKSARDKFALFLSDQRLSERDFALAAEGVRAQALWAALQPLRQTEGNVTSAYRAVLLRDRAAGALAQVALDDPRLRGFTVTARQALFLEKGRLDPAPQTDRGVMISSLAEALPFLELIDAAPIIAFISSDLDSDGALRHYVPIQRFVDQQGVVRVYPSLMVGALLAARGKTMADVTIEPGRALVVPEGRKHPSVRLPLDESGRSRINWAGRWKEVFEYRSFARVLEDFRAGGERRARVEASFRDRYVFLGLTAVGTHDIKPNPLQKDFPMVGAHAHALNDALLGRPMVGYEGAVPWFVLALTLAGLAMGLCVASLRAWVWLALSGGGVLCWLWVAQYALKLGQMLPAATPLLALGVSLGTALGFNYLVVDRKRAQVKKMFSTYLAPQVVERLLEAGAAKPGGEKRHLTILFSDIAGFTAFSQRMDPERLTGFLNEYFTEMERIVTRFGGIVDKYIGDAVMAFFGAPGALPHHDRAGVQAAWAMQQALGRLNEQWGAQGLPELAIRIGVNTGEVLVGNLGSPHKVNYTVIGDAVNLASRLESANKFWGFSIMIAESNAEAAGLDYELLPVGRLVVKGRDRPIGVHAVLGSKGTLSEEEREATRAFTEALETFWRGDFDVARFRFESLTEAPLVAKAASRYVKQCQQAREAALDQSWTGEFVMEEK